MIQGNDCALDSAEGQGHGEEERVKLVIRPSQGMIQSLPSRRKQF